MKADYSKLPPECDELCQWRWCLHKGENKGTYVPGRGYASYYKEPHYVCMTRILRGCPEVQGHRPLPDKDKMIKELSETIQGVKATNKIKREMCKMLETVKRLFEIAEKESVSKMIEVETVEADKVDDFIPRTALGEKLLAIRNQFTGRKLTEDEVVDLLNERNAK